MLGTAAGSSLCIPQIHERAHPAKLLMLLTAERRAKPPRHCRAAPALSFQDKPSFLTGERENSWVPGIPVHQQHTQELGNMQLFGTDRGCISILSACGITAPAGSSQLVGHTAGTSGLRAASAFQRIPNWTHKDHQIKLPVLPRTPQQPHPVLGSSVQALLELWGCAHSLGSASTLWEKNLS